MLAKNVDLMLRQISSSDTVLDIGGWAKPFNRANYVIDIMPYETRGYFGSTGPKQEFFSKDTWIIHDVSSSKPLPFRDKEIDFVVCSHVLEDIRDPIHLCQEIIRIGKRGYIEVPSRTVESVVGVGGKNCIGYWHHRWMVEIKSSEITFRFKNHLLYDSWKFHFPRSYLGKLNEEQRFAYLFWRGSFHYKEVIQIAYSKVASEQEEFVRRRRAHSQLFYTIEDLKRISRTRMMAILRKSAMLRMLVRRILHKGISATKNESLWSSLPDTSSR